MLIKKFQDQAEFIAGDNTILREYLHPDKDNVELRYSLAHAINKIGASSAPHKLKTSEVYYILQGRGQMHIDNQVAEVEEGDVVYIPPHSVQFIKNIGTGDLKFLCIVDPAWRVEDEQILQK